MTINNAAAAAEFVAAWAGHGRARSYIALALEGLRQANAIERSYSNRYDQIGTLAAIAVLERALVQLDVRQAA